MFYDPYTLTILPGSCGRAEGTVYLDDETTFAHEELGMFAIRRFVFTGAEIQSTNGKSGFFSLNKGKNLMASPQFTAPNTVERIVIAGQMKAPKRIVLKTGTVERDLSFVFDPVGQVLTIKKPAAKVIDNWVIALEY